MEAKLFGFLTIDKSSGATSRQAVDVVKKLVRPAKIGHAGTLDPLATGVLVLCIGPATRLTTFVQQMPKTYIADFQFGVTSASDDTETELNSVENAPEISLEALNLAIPKFVGEISQVPPEFSAIKVAGQRAYRLSRAGKAVELKARQITVHQIEVIDFDYPRLRLRIDCGSGTYIRSIGRDLGTALGSGAVMTGLRRTAIGSFTESTAIGIEDLTSQQIQQNLRPPLQAFESETVIQLDSAGIEHLKNGGMFQGPDLGLTESSQRGIAVDSSGKLLGILTRHRSGQFNPSLNFISYYGDSLG